MSRLEPSADDYARADSFAQSMREAGYVIVYSVSSRDVKTEPMSERILKLNGINQQRLTAAMRSDFKKNELALTLRAERKWLRDKMGEADAIHGTQSAKVFDEVIRLFPGTRFVERRQGRFVDETASGGSCAVNG